METPTIACIIGAGPGGICMAYHLKKKLGCDDSVIVDQNEGVGGTWYSNSYPGCSCDVPSHYYSFSFALNPGWTRPLADRDEVRSYLDSVVDRFDLRGHLSLTTRVSDATWDASTETWQVTLENLKSAHRYKRRFKVLVAACGIFHRPKLPKIPRLDSFRGRSWHTGQWDSTYDIKDKTVAVIGNGCSGCQVIPTIAPDVALLVHFARSKQWYFERPNELYSPLTRWAFRTIPLLQRLFRVFMFNLIDFINFDNKSPRISSEKKSREYMLRKTPSKYLDQIMPDYPVGCKRILLDPGYLDSLHRTNVELVSDKITAIDATGIQLANGAHVDVDVIVYATGFYTQEYLAPLAITGQDGMTLDEHWRQTNGCQAYLGMTVAGFPNTAIIFGPNTSPARNLVIFLLEVQAAYIAQALFDTILKGRASTVVVKSAEEYDCNLIQQRLKDSVSRAGCTNWALNEAGRNSTHWPGSLKSYWFNAWRPRFKDYVLTGKQASGTWRDALVKMQQNMPS